MGQKKQQKNRTTFSAWCVSGNGIQSSRCQLFLNSGHFAIPHSHNLTMTFCNLSARRELDSGQLTPSDVKLDFNSRSLTIRRRDRAWREAPHKSNSWDPLKTRAHLRPRCQLNESTRAALTLPGSEAPSQVELHCSGPARLNCRAKNKQDGCVSNVDVTLRCLNGTSSQPYFCPRGVCLPILGWALWQANNGLAAGERRASTSAGLEGRS